jgi:tetratricopeptide (TPR) repeat protein
MRPPTRAAALLALIALATSAAYASADGGEPIPPKARKLAERGRQLHERGDYARAIVAFKEAYVLAPSPGLLFNLAQAYRLQGNCDDAALMYRRYLAAAPWSDERALAEGHLSTVTRCVQKRTLNLPLDAAMASIPDAPHGELDPLFDDDPGRDERSGGRLARRIGLGTTIAGALVLGGAVFYGVQSYRAAQQVERMYEGGAKWPEIEPIHARGERAATTAKWLGIGGGAGAAAGVTLFILGRRAERAAPVAITPIKGGVRVGLAWEF